MFLGTGHTWLAQAIMAQTDLNQPKLDMVTILISIPRDRSIFFRLESLVSWLLVAI